MTEFIAGITAVVMSLTMGVAEASASARNHCGNADGVRGNRGGYVNFTDENGDGVCDNRVDNENCPQDGTGKRAGNGCAFKNTNFTDENDDGVCDNKCNNADFTDEDGDGICDNKGGGLNCQKDVTGRKAGQHMGRNK